MGTIPQDINPEGVRARILTELLDHQINLQNDAEAVIFAETQLTATKGHVAGFNQKEADMVAYRVLNDILTQENKKVATAKKRADDLAAEILTNHSVVAADALAAVTADDIEKYEKVKVRALTKIRADEDKRERGKIIKAICQTIKLDYSGMTGWGIDEIAVVDALESKADVAINS